MFTTLNQFGAWQRSVRKARGRSWKLSSHWMRKGRSFLGSVPSNWSGSRSLVRPDVSSSRHTLRTSRVRVSMAWARARIGSIGSSSGGSSRKHQQPCKFSNSLKKSDFRKKIWYQEKKTNGLKITKNLMSSLSDDLIVWKNLISEILRNSQTFQIIRKPEHQIVSYSQSFRRPASLKNKPSDILRNFQIFSVFFRHSQIIRSSDH